jgi:hypothetical protein
MGRWGVILGVYGLLSLLAGAGAAVLHGDPFVHPEPWLELTPLAAHGYSGIVGLTFGLLVALGTRLAVGRLTWATTLHEELRPLARGLSPLGVLAAAALSSLGEELLFRSVLAPLIGLVPQALLFGVAHQLPGRARFTWVFWATIMGLVLGALFQATGSLVGPVLAHATINALNLRFLQAHDAAPRPRSLGGVLGQRT